MATTKVKYDTRKALLDYSVYAPLGAGQLLIEKAKELSGKASELSGKAVSLAQDQRKAVLDAYGDLAGRGEKLVSSVRRSAYTKRAVAQSKTARTQVKAAATSIRKAAGSTATATKAAAKKVS